LEDVAMAGEQAISMEGGCTCRAMRYRLKARPMFVHCCHCTWCQRETGSAFAVNALIEASNVEILQGEPKRAKLPSASGRGQIFSRCAQCGIVLWSNYAGAGERVHFIRAGTLDDTSVVRPTSTSTHPPSSLGWCCRRAFQPSRSSTSLRTIGRRLRSTASRPPGHRHRPDAAVHRRCAAMIGDAISGAA
jgi:hypothetical protein